uniref:Uncharacterized protein n=1 Tax=Arundo donax TaxID=35708 RepID=A0A0A9HXM2_ARUDO
MQRSWCRLSEGAKQSGVKGSVVVEITRQQLIFSGLAPAEQ